MPLLLALLACAPSSEPPAAVANVAPFCTWTDEVLCTDQSNAVPLDGEILLLHICLDYDSNLTVCSGGGWRVYDNGTWEPQMCTLGFYYRACIGG